MSNPVPNAPMRFIGRLWFEEGQMRGKVSFLNQAGQEGKTAFFTDLEDLKKQLEQQLAHHQPNKQN